MFTKLFQNYKFLICSSFAGGGEKAGGGDEANKTEESALSKVKRFLNDMTDSIDENDLAAAKGIRENMEDADKELQQKMKEAGEYVKNASAEDRDHLSEIVQTMVQKEYTESLAGGVNINSERALDVFKELVNTIDPAFNFGGITIEALQDAVKNVDGTVPNEMVLEFKDGVITLMAPVINETTGTKDLNNKKIQAYGTGGEKITTKGNNWSRRTNDSDFDNENILDHIENAEEDFAEGKEKAEADENKPSPEAQEKIEKLTEKLNKAVTIDSKNDFNEFVTAVQTIDKKFVDVSTRYEDIRRQLLNQKGDKEFTVSYQLGEVRIFEPMNGMNEGVNGHTFSLSNQGRLYRDSSFDVDITKNNEKVTGEIDSTTLSQEQESHDSKIQEAGMRIQSINDKMPADYSLSIQTHIPGVSGDKPKVQIQKTGETPRTGYMTIENPENASRVLNDNDFSVWVNRYIKDWGDSSTGISDTTEELSHPSNFTKIIESKISDTGVTYNGPDEDGIYTLTKGFVSTDINPSRYSNIEDFENAIDTFILASSSQLPTDVSDADGIVIPEPAVNSTESIADSTVILYAVEDKKEDEALNIYHHNFATIEKILSEFGENVKVQKVRDSLDAVAIVIDGHSYGFNLKNQEIHTEEVLEEALKTFITEKKPNFFENDEGPETPTVTIVEDTHEYGSETSELTEKSQEYINDPEVQAAVAQVSGFSLFVENNMLKLYRDQNDIQQGQHINLLPIGSEPADWEGALETKETLIRWIEDFYRKDDLIETKVRENEGALSNVDEEVVTTPVEIQNAIPIRKTVEVEPDYERAKNVYEQFITTKKLGVMYRPFIESTLKIDEDTGAYSVYNTVKEIQKAGNQDGLMGSKTLKGMLEGEIEGAVDLMADEFKVRSADSLKIFINDLGQDLDGGQALKQSVLDALGVPNGLDDNNEVAIHIIQYQLENGLEPDGIFGNKSISSLLHEIAGVDTSPAKRFADKIGEGVDGLKNGGYCGANVGEALEQCLGMTNLRANMGPRDGYKYADFLQQNSDKFSVVDGITDHAQIKPGGILVYDQHPDAQGYDTRDELLALVESRTLTNRQAFGHVEVALGGGQYFWGEEIKNVPGAGSLAGFIGKVYYPKDVDA